MFYLTAHCQKRQSTETSVSTRKQKKLKKNKHCSVICLLYNSLKAAEHLYCHTVFAFLRLLLLYTSTHFINVHVLKNTQQNINDRNSLQHWSILSCPLTSPLTSEQLSLQKQRLLINANTERYFIGTSAFYSGILEIRGTLCHSVFLSSAGLRKKAGCERQRQHRA